MIGDDQFQPDPATLPRRHNGHAPTRDAANGERPVRHDPADGRVDEAAVVVLRRRVAAQLTEHARRYQQQTGAPLPDADRTGAIEETISGVLDAYAAEQMAAGRPPLHPHAESAVRRRIRDDLIGSGGMQRWLDDEQVEDIVANGCDHVHVRRTDGRWEPVAPIAASDAEMVELVRTLAARSGEDERRWDRADPILDVQLPDGARLHAVMSVSRCPSLSIRRHRYPRLTLADLVDAGTLDADLAALLTAAVDGRSNIVIAGRTGAGKTTMLRALASAIDPQERIVTIEDSYELGLDRDTTAHPNVVPLQAREPNVEGVGGITMSRLFRAGLRMAPDRVIVGEVRGDETITMLQAMSQGNDGSLSTIHARSSAGAFAKLALYAMESPQQIPPATTAMLIAESVNLVVHLAILPGNRRAVSSVREVVGADGIQVASNEIYQPGPDGAAVPGAPMSTGLATLLAAHGYTSAPPAGNGWWPDRRPS